jgi:hypothetical protein
MWKKPAESNTLYMNWNQIVKINENHGIKHPEMYEPDCYIMIPFCELKIKKGGFIRWGEGMALGQTQMWSPRQLLLRHRLLR